MADTYTISPIRTSVVWFDLDDTIIDFFTNSRRALERLYITEHLDRFFSTADSWIETYEHYNHRLWAMYSAAEIDQQQLRMDRFRLPLTEAGAEDAVARKMSACFDPLYLDYLAQEKELIPGAMQLLEQVHEAGLTIGILSNGFTEVQHRKIQNCGIAHLINIIVLSDDIGINKPDIRIYQHAMRQSGISDPCRHLMIGDNPATDIAGARSAGWDALLFLRNPALQPPACTPSVRHLSSISVAKLP